MDHALLEERLKKLKAAAAKLKAKSGHHPDLDEALSRLDDDVERANSAAPRAKSKP